MKNKPEMFYPYNETFEIYGPPKAGLKRAKEFCEKIQGKSGNWIIHTEKQHDEWWNSKGKFANDAKGFYEFNINIKPERCAI